MGASSMEAVVITYQRAYHEICKIMISERYQIHR